MEALLAMQKQTMTKIPWSRQKYGHGPLLLTERLHGSRENFYNE